jgi:hypothetical protein
MAALIVLVYSFQSPGTPDRRVTDFLPRTRQTIDAAKDCSSDESRAVVLNKHCPVCDFQSRCRDIAISREDLSLLRAMIEKERAKCSERGISTITQLSYGYRPRRRKRIKSKRILNGKAWMSSTLPDIINY